MQESIAQLQRHLKAVQSKRPGWAVGLWGEAGVGKTFTVQTLLRESPIQSLSIHSTASLQSLAESLPHHDKLPLWAKQVLERQAKNESVPPQNLIEALVAALSHLAPFVLHLEDIHEASVERLEWIQRLASLTPSLRGVGLIVTSRAEPTEPFKSYRMEPLDSAQLGELLQTQAKAKLPQEGLDWMFARTGGNPLFALEFWRYLLRQGFFWWDGEHWHWRTPPEDFVPVSVEALILQMLLLFEDTTSRNVLEARAILPADLSGEALNSLWATISGTDFETLAEAKHILHSKGILHGDHFAHPLMREVAEKEISPAHKEGYARRALEALGHQPQMAAAFIDAAGLESAERQARFQQAAEAAEALGHDVQAGRWLARAAETAEGGVRGTLAHRAARHLREVEPPEAIRLLEMAVMENSTNTSAIIDLAALYARMGWAAEMNRTLGRLPGDAATKSNWVKSLLNIRNVQRDHLGVVALWTEHPELHQAPDPDIAYQVGFAYMELNHPVEAEALATAALQKPDLSPPQKVKLLWVCGLARRLTGDLKAAKSFLDQAVVYAETAGHTTLAASLHNRQIVLRMLGHFGEAVADLHRSVELYRSAGLAKNYASSLSSLGDRLRAMGQYEAAEAHLLEAQQTLSRLDNSGFLCIAECNLCELYLSWRPPHGLRLAQKYAALAQAHAQTLEPFYQAYALGTAAMVTTELGQAEEGLELANRALGLEQVIADVRTVALMAKAAALEKLDSKTEAVEALEQARATALDELNRLQIELELARLQNNPELARERLEFFRQRGLLSIVNETHRKWPELNDAPEPDKAQHEMAQTAKAEGPTLYLRVLGVPGLELAGQTLPVRAKKRLEMMCYLLEARIAGRAEVDILELMEVFYPDLSEDRAKLTLRQLIYLIRTNLGEGSVQSTPNGYALGAIGSDIEDFLKAGDAGLWRGPYLHSLSEGWNANVRDGLVLALRSKVEALQSADPAQATRLGQIWLEMEPYDLDALRLTIQAFRNQGNTKAAERAYNEGLERLSEVGESLPKGLEEFLDMVAV